MSDAIWADDSAPETPNPFSPEVEVEVEATPASTSTENMSPAEAALAEKKLYKLNIDGTDEEVDEETLIKRAQKYSAADKKFNESAQLRKQAEQLLTMLKQDPYSVLEQLGLDPTELSRSHLQRKIEELKMSPEEKELRDLRSYKEQQEQLRQQKEQEELTAKEEQLRSELSSKMTQEIIGALESVNLPRDESSIRMMVDIMRHQINNDVDITWEEAADIVRFQHEQNYKHFFSQMNVDALAQLLGEETVNKLVKRSTKKLFQPESPKEQPQPQPKKNKTYRDSVWDE